MSSLDRLFEVAQYGLAPGEKTGLLIEELDWLTQHHRERCLPYRRVLETLYPAPGPSRLLEDVPFIPTRLFKTQRLSSVEPADVARVLVSSGTTSNQLTAVSLDRDTAVLQTRALAAIMTAFVGAKRLPMVLVDAPASAKPGAALTARGAGLLGMATFGRDHFYALDDQMRLDVAGLQEFLARHRGQRVLVFGFTFMVWQYLYQALRGRQVRFDDAILIHSGGWKKLQDLAVDNTVFKASLLEDLGISRVHNFYGMVEQVGSVYMECERGFLHAPNFAEILVRDHRDWSVLEPGQEGVLQTLSVLPRSYPGHSILTEDLGVVEGTDDCACGRHGTYFTVRGRIARAELRGCSDTHAAQAA